MLLKLADKLVRCCIRYYLSENEKMQLTRQCLLALFERI